MGRLTTHVLDTAAGRPAAGMQIDLERWDGAAWQTLKRVRANADGRTDEPLLAGAALQAGAYRLTFGVAEYFRARGAALDEPPFLDRVPVCFGLADTQAHYHVPLLVSPWTYTTYRGS